MIHSHKDLVVWQKSMLLVHSVYELTSQFSADERFGLASQMQRAVVAIPSNIAEGYARFHRKEYIQFLSIALGSTAELETQIVICQSLNKFLGFDFTSVASQTREISKMLFCMIRQIRKSQ